jgi:hypothetical protein
LAVEAGAAGAVAPGPAGGAAGARAAAGASTVRTPRLSSGLPEHAQVMNASAYQADRFTKSPKS